MNSFFKFGTLSGGGWLLDCSLLLFLSQGLDVKLGIANFLSSSIAAITVFTISRYIVFVPVATRSKFATLIYFIYTCCVIIVASAVIGPIGLFCRYVADYLMINMTIGELSFMAKVLITPPQLMANFLVSRYLIENSRLGEKIV